MGDMADYLTEMEMDAWTLHQTGQCGEFGICQYCEEEDDEGHKSSGNSDGREAGEEDRLQR